jgi:hypothetical protein
LAIRIFILSMVALLIGCKPSGPATTKTNSSAFTTVADRTKFLNEYVRFRRTYQTLDFDILYRNNDGGMVAAPSDWDIRLVATVAASELQAWIPPGVSAAIAPDTTWLKSVPTTLDLSGLSEWYIDGKRIVGIDRAKRIVVCRSSSM